MSPPVNAASNQMSSAGTHIPPNSNSGIHHVHHFMPNVPLPPPVPGLEGINFRPPMTTNQNTMVVHHVLHHYVPAPTATSNVRNWLHASYQPSISNFGPLRRFPPPPQFPNRGNAQVHCLSNQQIPIFAPRGHRLPVLSSHVNHYMPRFPSPAPSISMSPGSSTGRWSSSRTTLLVPKEDHILDPPSLIRDDHKCNACNRLFPSGNALGGHMSSHEKKRKRDRDRLRDSLTSVGTAHQASTTVVVDLTLGTGELDETNEDHRNLKVNRREENGGH